jgi:hypothetical protein
MDGLFTSARKQSTYDVFIYQPTGGDGKGMQLFGGVPKRTGQESFPIAALPSVA